MAINKRKILQSAQKHLQKGALDRALKDYRTLVEADPRDANVRLKVGDIYLRQGKTDEAVAAYLKVAQQFMKDGFDAKAVALFKQIGKIDSKRFDIYVPLAELYQRLGLTSDAMRALQTAADAHYREGDKPAALDVLRKMATLDPGNTTNRLKVAELLRHEGMGSEALSEYRECAAELERQGEIEGQLGVLEKLLELAPDDAQAWLATGRAHVALQKWSGAEQAGERVVEHFPEHAVEGCEILAEAYRGLRRDDALPDLYRRMAEVLRARGEEDRAREILQRYVPADGFSVESEDLLETGEEDLLLDDSLGEAGGDAPALDLDAEFPETQPVIETPVDPQPAATPPAPAPAAAPLAVAPAAADASAQGDPEQLFAEASVYRRYGKNDRAIDSLRSILALELGDRSLLERLAESFEACGALPEAVDSLSRAARCALDAGDAESFAGLRARVEALDPTAAQQLGPEPAAASAPEMATPEIHIEIDDGLEATDSEPATALAADAEVGIELDIDLDEPPDLGAEMAEPALQVEVTAPDVEMDVSAGGMDLDFDFEDSGAAEEDSVGSDAADAEDGADPDVAVLEDSFEAMPEFAGDESSEPVPPPAPEPQIEFDLGDEEPEASESESAELQASEPEPGELDPAAEFGSPQRIAEALDEAAFYFQQGLYDESEAVYRRVLESAPSHPQALLRLGEIEACREGESSGRSEEIVVVDEPSEGPPFGDSFSAEGLEEEAEEQALAPALDLGDVTAELDVDDVDDPGETTAPVEAEAPVAVEVAAEAPIAEPDEVVDSVEPEAPAPPEVGESGDFDLAKELSGVFHDDGEASSAGGAGDTEEEGFEEVFAAFKKGVEETLGEEDHEAHYDLGIAYREMGLVEDALGEFRAALHGSKRRIDALHMLGVCALDLGRAADAIEHLQQALSLPDAPAEQQIALRFDLGRAYEADDDRDRAREAWEAVAEADPHFCDVDERLAGLDGEALLASDDDEDDFESFEDLVAEAEQDEPAAAAEAAVEEPPQPERSYESFDDLVAETEEDEDDSAAAESPDPVAAAPEPAVAESPVPAAEEPEPPAEEPPAEKPAAGRKKRRKKKISFV